MSVLICPPSSSLVGLIFDGADSGKGIQPSLMALAEWLGAHAAHAMFIEGGRILESHSCGGDRSGFERYEKHWIAQDPRYAAAAASPGRVLSDVAIVEPHEFEASAIYNELLRSTGVRYSLFSSEFLSSELVVGYALMRARRAGPFDVAHIQMLSEVQPHLRRAAQLRQLILGMKREVDDLRRALDVVPGAVVILDGKGRMICLNASAEQLIARQDGLRVKEKRLVADVPSEALAIAAAVSSTASFAEGAKRCAAVPHSRTAIAVSRREKSPLHVVLMPLRPTNSLRLNASEEARVLAVIHDPDASPRIKPELIAELHGLTVVESLLAAALVQGKSLAEFADERGCSEQTARTHLKRVLDKTATRRQSDLVRVLLGSAVLHLASVA